MRAKSAEMRVCMLCYLHLQTPETLVKGISKNDFRDLLNLATKESLFTFNNKFYIQANGVTMGSPLVPIFFIIFCDFKTFHFEIDHLKTILMKNNCPPNFIDSCIKSFLNKLYAPKVIVQNVPKKMLLLSCRSWKVLRFKFERKFKNYLVIN